MIGQWRMVSTRAKTVVWPSVQSCWYAETPDKQGKKFYRDIFLTPLARQGSGVQGVCQSM